MQIPIFKGAYVDAVGDFRASYPLNLQPVPKQAGVGQGYLRTTEGCSTFGPATPGRWRGGIAWNGVLYGVCGSQLCTFNAAGAITQLGPVGDNGFDAVFDFSFDRLCVASAGVLYYWQPANGTNPGLTSVTDVDVGIVNYVKWIDGYFAVTDGNTIAVTELNDPYSVNPLKYGSAEESPDKIQALLRINDNLVAIGSLTCEFFQNVGGDLFPFQRIKSALIERGACSPFAVALYTQTFAFVGNGINEALAIYLATPGGTSKISDADIEQALADAGGATALGSMRIEVRVQRGAQLLYVHLPQKSFVYDIDATAVFNAPMWFTVSSGSDGASAYRCRNFVFCYEKWIFGDLQGAQLGYLRQDLTSQFGSIVPYQFDTMFAYNKAGGILHSLELAHNPGSIAPSPSQYTLQISFDGRAYGDGLLPSEGTPLQVGQTRARTHWEQICMFDQRMLLRVRGANDAPDSFAVLDAEVEPLAW